MKPKSRTNVGRVAAASIGAGAAAAAALLAAPLVSTAAESPDAVAIAGTDEPDDTIDSAETVVGEETSEADAEVESEVTDEGLVGPQLEVLPAPPGFPDGPGADGPGFPGRRVGRPAEGRFRIVNGEVLAEALGIDVETLRDELRSGATVAEIADASGADLQVVIDALVADYTERVTAWIDGEPPVTDDVIDDSADDTADSPDTTTETTSA